MITPEVERNSNSLYLPPQLGSVFLRISQETGAPTIQYNTVRSTDVKIEHGRSAKIIVPHHPLCWSVSFSKGWLAVLALCGWSTSAEFSFCFSVACSSAWIPNQGSVGYLPVDHHIECLLCRGVTHLILLTTPMCCWSNSQLAFLFGFNSSWFFLSKPLLLSLNSTFRSLNHI